MTQITKQLLTRLEEEIDAEIGDREHRWTGSNIDAFDAGYNAGVGAATQVFRERLEVYLND